jgi:4-hydroxy-3-methylbut-2-enyl diphosphate reductase
MCFGVRDALAAAGRVPQPQHVTIMGELVHNPAVTQHLTQLGFAHHPPRASIPATQTVMITAHGVSNAARAALQRAGKSIVDTTCPLVKKAHDAALRLAANGFFVVVIGKPDHVEVIGLTGDLAACAVVATAADVRQYAAKRIGVICQTTTAAPEAAALCAQIVRQNPQAQVRFVDTICQPTKDRQLAMERLLDVVEAVVVVGGRHSNNTRKLVERSLERGVPAWHVEQPEELCAAWFAGCQCVGLTAGTSTLPETVKAVEARLTAMETRRWRLAV